MPIDFGAAMKEEPKAEPVSQVVPAQDTEPAVRITTIEQVKEALTIWDAQIAAVEDQASALVVEDEASNVVADDMGHQANKLIKDLAAARLAIVGKPDKYVRTVNALFKPYTDRFKAVKTTIDHKGAAYLRHVEFERRKKEELARKATEEAQRKLDAEAKEAGIEPVKLDAPVVPTPPPVSRSELGTTSTRKVWTAEIIDPKKVPRVYCTPDMKKIRQAVKDGIRQMAGVKITEEVKIVRRSN